MKSVFFLLAAAFTLSATAVSAQTTPTGSVGTGASQAGTVNTTSKAGTYDTRDLDPNTNKSTTGRKSMKSKDKSMKTKTKMSKGDSKMNSQM